MDTQEEKEFIYIIPPAYHFKRAAMFKVAAKAFENIGLHREALKMETDSVYEVALGIEALVYQSCGQPA